MILADDLDKAATLRLLKWDNDRMKDAAKLTAYEIGKVVNVMLGGTNADEDAGEVEIV